MLPVLDNDTEEQEDFFITVRRTLRGIQLPSRGSILLFITSFEREKNLGPPRLRVERIMRGHTGFLL